MIYRLIVKKAMTRKGITNSAIAMKAIKGSSSSTGELGRVWGVGWGAMVVGETAMVSWCY